MKRSLLRFKFPRDGEFSIPAEWWVEARMEGFERGSEVSYLTLSPEASLVEIEDIAPPNMDRRQHLDHGGLGHERLVDLLHRLT